MDTVPCAYERGSRKEFIGHRAEQVTVSALTAATKIVRRWGVASGQPAKMIRWLTGQKECSDPLMFRKCSHTVDEVIGADINQVAFLSQPCAGIKVIQISVFPDIHLSSLF